MSFLAGFTGCCIGLCTKLYSNALRKLPYMRGISSVRPFFFSPPPRALGTRSLYGRRRHHFLLRKEVHCSRFCDF